MALLSTAYLISSDSRLGKSMKLTEDMFVSCGPIAKTVAPLPIPFPLASDQDLTLNINTRELQSTKKSLVFPRYLKEWNDVVVRMKETYSGAWTRIGIYGLVDLSTHEITMAATVLEGALNFWSTNCNSLILPLGAMSITLRDVVAITGLPIFGAEVVSRIECVAFPNVTNKCSGTYMAMTTKLASMQNFDDDDHLIFIWILLSQWIFEPMGCCPTSEVLVIAKALVTGQELALGTMLLANTYHRLSIAVNEAPFSKLKGGLWLFQLWIFTYFPCLATNIYQPRSPYVGVDVCYHKSDLSLKQILTFFRTQIPTSLNRFFLFSDQEDSLLPECAKTFFHATNKEDSQWWKLFCLTRKLHHGTSKTRNPRAPAVGMVLYAPCLWSRQFGLFQAIPGQLPFPSYQDRYGASEEAISNALVAAEAGSYRSHGIVFLGLDQPSFDTWWSELFKLCIPLHDASGSPGYDLRTPNSVQTKYSDPAEISARLRSSDSVYKQNIRCLGRNQRAKLGSHNTPFDPVVITESESSYHSNEAKTAPRTLTKGKETLVDVLVNYVHQKEESDEEEIQSEERQEVEQKYVDDGVDVEASKPKIETSEDSFLIYDDGGAYADVRMRLSINTTKRNDVSLSDVNTLYSSPGFELDSMFSEPLPMRPPASELLPGSSSLNILLDSHPSQESCLTDIRLEPVELQIENLFEDMDLSFMTGYAPLCHRACMLLVMPMSSSRT